MTDTPLNTQGILDGIQHLIRLRSQLIDKDLSPPGASIHNYVVHRVYVGGFVGEYCYAKWQSPKPIFKRNPKKNGRPLKKGRHPKLSCHLHIGRVFSNTGLGTEPEVEEAYEQFNNRKRLESVESALEQIQLIVSKFRDEELR